MKKFREIFKSRHVFLPVVHVENREQALLNVEIARDEGADGAFLINHRMSAKELIRSYQYVSSRVNDFWIGLNCLDMGRGAINVIPQDTDGLWVDDVGITEEPFSTDDAATFTKLRGKARWQGLYFGGVAFKYRPSVNDLDLMTRTAAEFVDVITTSGIGTGKAPLPEKIRAMKHAAGDVPLAIASGITPKNVVDYMPHADCFMVATGISVSHAEFDPPQVRALARALGK